MHQEICHKPLLLDSGVLQPHIGVIDTGGYQHPQYRHAPSPVCCHHCLHLRPFPYCLKDPYSVHPWQPFVYSCPALCLDLYGWWWVLRLSSHQHCPDPP